jgi:hypothetical protein
MELQRRRKINTALATVESSGGQTMSAKLVMLLGYAEAVGDPIGAVPRPMIRRGRRGTVRGRDGRAPQGSNKRQILQAVLDGLGSARASCPR